MNRLNELPEASKIFVDSNILTYHLLKDPIHGLTCKQFIERIENGDVAGFVSPVVISETIYNFIKAHIVRKYGLKPKDTVPLMKAKPEVIAEADIGRVSELFEIFNILPISDVAEVYEAIKRYALLPNDAFHVVVMKNYGIENIATNDRDFERVDWIKVWIP